MENNTTSVSNNDQTKAKCVFKPWLVRGLIKSCGHKIIDLKPNRNVNDRAVFVFEDSLKLRDDMQKMAKEHRERGENEKVMYDNTENDINSKCVFKLSIARSLVKDYKQEIIDIKPFRDNPARTVFVFKDSLEFRDAFQDVVKKRKERFSSIEDTKKSKPEQED